MKILPLFRRETPLTRAVALAVASGGTVTDGASGNPANFTTDVAKPLEQLLVAFGPVQAGSGDPSPTNVRNISGFAGVNIVRCGVNLWDEEWETGNIDGNGQNTPGVDFRSKNYIPVVPGMKFYAYYELPDGKTPGSNLRLFYYDRSKTYISNTWAGPGVKTVPSNACYMRFYGDSQFGGENDHVSINFPSTDTEYHAYTGDNYEIPFGATYYGGIVDVISGVLTVDYGVIDLGELSWDVASGSGSVKYFRSSVLTGAKKISGTGVLANIYCSIFKTVTASSIYSGLAVDNSIGQDDSANARIRVKATSYNDDADAFGTAMDGVSLVYELATPQTVQLDPETINAIKGTNNVLSDANGLCYVTFLKKK